MTNSDADRCLADTTGTSDRNQPFSRNFLADLAYLLVAANHARQSGRQWIKGRQRRCAFDRRSQCFGGETVTAAGYIDQIARLARSDVQRFAQRRDVNAQADFLDE